MRPDGTDVEQLTESEGFDGDPVWVPRGAFGEGG
jgi:Tol biopolymer transport system component